MYWADMTMMKPSTSAKTRKLVMALQMPLAMRVNRMEFMPAVSCHDHSHANPTGGIPARDRRVAYLGPNMVSPAIKAPSRV